MISSSTSWMPSRITSRAALETPLSESKRSFHGASPHHPLQASTQRWLCGQFSSSFPRLFSRVLSSLAPSTALLWPGIRSELVVFFGSPSASVSSEQNDLWWHGKQCERLGALFFTKLAELVRQQVAPIDSKALWNMLHHRHLGGKDAKHIGHVSCGCCGMASTSNCKSGALLSRPLFPRHARQPRELTMSPHRENTLTVRANLLGRATPGKVKWTAFTWATSCCRWSQP